jgi:hypothetical protein
LIPRNGTPASLLTNASNVSILPKDPKLDILKALRREEKKLEKNAKNVLKHLRIVRATVKFFSSTKPKLAGRKRRKMSKAARAKISAAQKSRWAKWAKSQTK